MQNRKVVPALSCVIASEINKVIIHSNKVNL